MTTKHSPAVAIALTHIDAWSRHDWNKTRELLAPDVHAVMASTQPQFGGSGGRAIIGSDERDIFFVLSEQYPGTNH